MKLELNLPKASGWRRGHHLVILGLLLMVAAAPAATVQFSAEPRATTVNATDDLLLNQTNTGAGTYTTKRVAVAVIASSVGTNTYPLLSAKQGNFGSVTVTNQIYFNEQSWSGPTNSISGSNAFYYYTNLVNPGLSITSIVAGASSPSSFQLRIFQNTGSNANMTLPSGTKTQDGSLSVVCTNGVDTFLQIWQGDRNVVRHETDY